MPILNYTTKVAAERSVAEIQKLLAKAGASAIMIEYEQGEPQSLAFQLRGMSYRLPCRAAAVGKILERQRVEPRYRKPEHVRSVAWRILKAWCEAQLAIIESSMVNADEVFMPYRLMSTGETMYEHGVAQDRLLADSKLTS